MKRISVHMIGRAMQMAAHSGFPWASGLGAGHSLALRRAIRRSVAAQWPAPIRPLALALSACLWPVESLKDAFINAFSADEQVLAGRSRVILALRAWAAALVNNLPPVDFVGYRLFERDRPGPGAWLHSADSGLHFRRIAAPDVRELAWDKLAFSEFAAAAGAGSMPVLAVYSRNGPIRPFADGRPPPVDLLVKPRRGSGGVGHMVWRWISGRHVGASDKDLEPWLLEDAGSGDLLVQELARPPERFGETLPRDAPVVSVITAEWPDRQRRAAMAVVSVNVAASDGDSLCVREIDIDSGRLMPVSPGHAMPIFGNEPDHRDLGPIEIPEWRTILGQIDAVHEALPGPGPVLKWDVILTDRGPRLLEVNSGTGVYVLQSMTLRPITETPVGSALEAWAR